VPAKSAKRVEPSNLHERPDKGGGSVLLQTCQSIRHSEVLDGLKAGGALQGAIVEAQDDNRKPMYALFILTSWRKGYCVLRVKWPDRPRLFKDLDLLLVIVRFEYGYTGTIALKRASEM
jgi:hypothetical protein